MAAYSGYVTYGEYGDSHNTPLYSSQKTEWVDCQLLPKETYIPIINTTWLLQRTSGRRADSWQSSTARNRQTREEYPHTTPHQKTQVVFLSTFLQQCYLWDVTLRRNTVRITHVTFGYTLDVNGILLCDSTVLVYPNHLTKKLSRTLHYFAGLPPLLP